MSELAALRTTLAKLEAERPRLCAMPVARRIASLASAASALRDPERQLGRTLRTELERTSGLSSEGVAWALDTTLATITESALAATVEAAERAGGGARVLPRGLAAVVLSANVGTAPLTALTLPLLFGNPTLAKASSRDEVAASALFAALYSVDAELADALAVVSFPGGARELEDAMLARADAMVVYGGDATLDALRARTRAGSSFVAHGHGLGVAYVASEVLADPSRRAAAVRALALDVAAYDQRGCLSPHLVAVQGDDDAVRSFARALAEEGLPRIERSMPRGKLPAEAAAPQLAWRGVAVARGELFEGSAHAVSLELDGPMRPSPGYRNLQVVKLRDEAELLTGLGSFGVHLKQLGVAGDDATLARIGALLLPPSAPRIVRLGSMQTPEFGGIWDGELSFTGLVRYAARP